ncbi:transporter substrate-binding domain-containing protein [Methylobacterium soli]|uniref:Transporter substrate-binding domain-containing protein n=1 Tax=Methylobacterium soli TaxID=553447 RepID=A0A6L3SXS4_9HYPH|nr:transporter substrate-binding domain-containing protein [Methylobacterium soli]KAB1077428.1 transporter substrate-binding domain-containing protein [Methylobacterium soli]GJE44214.1 ABC transporter glutamine-binding protein GlnH [Methylobacterium soli]
MDRFQSDGRLIAGVSFDIPGMGYKSPQTGTITGFEADLARAVGEKIFGSADHVDFFQVTDAERIQDLQKGRVDFVVSQLTITPDRAEQVDFSAPYCVTREGLLVPKESSITRFEDLKGKRIAVTDGSVSLRRMRAALPSLLDATLVITPLSAGNLDAIDKGEADAASNDMINLTMLRAGSAHPERYSIIDIGDRFDPKPFGMAVKKGDRTLLCFLDQAIESLKVYGKIDRMLDNALASLARR